MRTKIVRWGNSLGLRIPKSFAEELSVSDGTPVELSLEEGRLVIRAAKPKTLVLDDLLAEVKKSNLHGETDTGGSVGGEVW
jgi:antitoxin MazE